MIIRSHHQIELPGGGGLLMHGDNELLGLQDWQRKFIDDLVGAGYCEIVKKDDAPAQAAPAAAASPSLTSSREPVHAIDCDLDDDCSCGAALAETAEPAAAEDERAPQAALATAASEPSPAPAAGAAPATLGPRRRRVRRPPSAE